MSQNSLVISDGTGVEVLAAINAALDTLKTTHSGASAPATPSTNMLWVDTANSVLKRYDGASWVTLGTLGTNMGMIPAAGGGTITGDLTLSGASSDLAVGGNTTLTGTLGVTGLLSAVNATLTGDLTLSGAGADLAVGGNSTLSGTLGVTGIATLSNALNQAQGADITAAATTNIATATGNFVNINNTTGTTTITALGTVGAGAMRFVRFNITGGSITLTHNGTSLILPGGQNISVTDGDCAIFASLGTGYWRCLGYQRNSLAARVWSVVSKTANYTVTASDYGAYFICTQTADMTLTMPAASTAGSGFVIGVSNRGTAGTKVTIDGNASETVDGLATQDLYPGSATAYICDGTGWRRMETGVVSTEPTYTNAQTYSASGTWVVPAGIYSARFTAIGGGGGGGGAYAGTTNTARSGGGGGGGGYASKIMGVTPGDTYTITINSGGGGGLSSTSSPTAGTAGGSASISGTAGTVTGNGGSGGGASTSSVNATGGAGGSGSGGTTIITGGAGGNGAGPSAYAPGGGGASAPGLSGGANNGQNGFIGTSSDITNGAAGSAGAAGGAGTHGSGETAIRESGGGGGSSYASNGNGGAPGAGGAGGYGYQAALVHPASGGKGAVFIEW